VLSVAIDGLALSDGSQYRGIGTYLRHLLPGLASEFDLTVLSDSSATLPAGVTRRVVHRRLPQRLRRREHAMRVPRELRRTGASLVHTPAHTPPRPCGLPWVHTVHDLTPLVFRHPLLDADRKQWLATGARLRDADAIVCVSQSTAGQVSRFFAVDPDRVHVAPLGVTADFSPDGLRRDDGAPYVIWASAWGPHKGLAEALATVAGLADAGLPHRLVLAGRQDPWMARQVAAAVTASPRPDLVDDIGFVEDMATLYRGADAVIVSSRAEGFGLPALEAMACGTPVVAFDNTSLPEVLGDAGVLAPDGDVGALVAAARNVLVDRTLHDDLAHRGVERARLFTWQRTVDAHAQAYRAAAEH
jgi:glycosyltransferase involved in cell wall biosynthesis